MKNTKKTGYTLNPQWWKRAVIYQIYPKSFCDANGDGVGDLQGIRSKIDYIHALGADVIWLSPIYQSPDRDNGYDISNYYDIQPAYGTMADFDQLLSEVHAKGMRLVMDLVVNHTSNEHPWYLDSARDVNSPFHDYYYWRKGKQGAGGQEQTPNNWNAYFGGSGWTRSAATGEYSLGVFSSFQPDLNWSNPALRQEIFKMMRFWLDKGIDGFRLDAIHCIGKDPSLPDSEDGQPIVNRPVVHDYLSEMNREVLSHYDVMTVGEAAGITTEDMLRYAGEDSHELSMMIQFFHVECDVDENGKWNLNSPDLVHLKKLFNKQQTELHGKAWTSLFWSNHDQPRAVSRLGTEDEEYRERSAKMIAVNTHLMCGTPFVYQGEELGMTNVHWKDLSELRDVESINIFHEFVDAGKKTPSEMLDIISAKGRDNARTPVQWDNSPNAGFTKVTPWIGVNPNYERINAADQIGRDDSVFAFYKELIRLRHENEIVISGTYEGVAMDDTNVFAYKRALDDREWLIICNFSDQPVNFDRKPYLDTAEPKVIIQNCAESSFLKNGLLQPYEAIVLSK